MLGCGLGFEVLETRMRKNRRLHGRAAGGVELTYGGFGYGAGMGGEGQRVVDREAHGLCDRGWGIAECGIANEERRGLPGMGADKGGLRRKTEAEIDRRQRRERDQLAVRGGQSVAEGRSHSGEKREGPVRMSHVN